MDLTSRKPLLKIIILGDSGVGKTSLIQRYVNQRFSVAYRKTIGADFHTKDIPVNDSTVTAQIWDTVGQERFQSLGVAFYRGADCVIFVYDITSPTSYESLNLWKDEFIAQGAPNNPKTFPFVVVANKIDLENKILCERSVQEIMKCDYQVPYFETSAKDDINVDKAFAVAAKMALERERKDISYSSFPATVNLKDSRNRTACYC